jgi:hypothetical protein
MSNFLWCNFLTPNPQVLYPVFRLQQVMIDAILGEAWWTKKIKSLEIYRQEKRDADMKQAQQLERQRIKLRDAQVRYKM